jgi:hypothetical protein
MLRIVEDFRQWIGEHRQRLFEILPDEADVIHDRTDGTTLCLSPADSTAKAIVVAITDDPIFEVICTPVRYVADVKMDVSQADSRSVRCGELALPRASRKPRPEGKQMRS